MAQMVQAPTRRPRAGGIKSVVPDFILETRLSVVNASGGLAWEDSGCGLPGFTRAGCYDDVVAQADKTYEGVIRYASIGDPFALYKGISCYIGGDDDRSYAEQARAIIEAGEDRLIEGNLATWAAGGPTADRATAIEALAHAEQYADANYVGQPVILMARETATILAGAGALVDGENGSLRTKQDTPVIASGMIAAGVILVTGAIAVYANNILVGEANVLEDNLGYAIAERVYDVGVDCSFRYRVTITPTP